jgi:hypothetical protein
MSLVLDSSATFAWVYADEITAPIRDVFNLVSENGASRGSHSQAVGGIGEYGT